MYAKNIESSQNKSTVVNILPAPTFALILWAMKPFLVILDFLTNWYVFHENIVIYNALVNFSAAL